MNKPIIFILGTGIMAAIALVFLINSFNPFIASFGIKLLFFSALCLLLISISTLLIYGLTMLIRHGLQYFIARYFGKEQEYFRPSFRRGILSSILLLIFVGLLRLDLFTAYFAGGAAVLLIILELFYSNHDKQTVKINKNE